MVFLEKRSSAGLVRDPMPPVHDPTLVLFLLMVPGRARVLIVLLGARLEDVSDMHRFAQAVVTTLNVSPIFDF